jgi:hypothetical protein
VDAIARRNFGADPSQPLYSRPDVLTNGWAYLDPKWR